MPPGQPGPPAGLGAAPDMGGLEEASPEEQQQYNRFVALAMLALYDDAMLPKVIEVVQSDEPDQGVGAIAASLAGRIYGEAKEEGTDLDGGLVMHALAEIVEIIVEIVETAGITTYTPQMMEAAYYAAADRLAEAAEQMGAYTEDDAIGDFNAINELKASGRLDAILQQVTAEQGGAPAGPPDPGAPAPPGAAPAGPVPAPPRGGL